jgi:hypothetical protein
MNSFNKYLSTLVLFGASFFSGCKEERTDNFVCIDCEKSVLRTNSIDGYYLGSLDAHPHFGCGFDYFRNRQGGEGNTLEVVGCNGKDGGNSIHMFWGFGELKYISVREGWNGETDKGLKINDDLDKYFSLYEGAVRIEGGRFQGDDLWKDGNLVVNFQNEKVWGMTLSRDGWRTIVGPYNDGPLWYHLMEECPDCEDILYTTGGLGLGEYKIGQYDRMPTCDITGGNSKGSLEDAIYQCDNKNSICMEWDKGLERIAVKSGWDGFTDTGLGIGSTLSEFLLVYPNAKQRIVKNELARKYIEIWTVEHLKVSTVKPFGNRGIEDYITRMEVNRHNFDEDDSSVPIDAIIIPSF